MGLSCGAAGLSSILATELCFLLPSSPSLPPPPPSLPPTLLLPLPPPPPSLPPTHPQFDETMIVYDACRLIRERVPDAAQGQRESPTLPLSGRGYSGPSEGRGSLCSRPEAVTSVLSGSTLACCAGVLVPCLPPATRAGGHGACGARSIHTAQKEECSSGISYSSGGLPGGV